MPFLFVLVLGNETTLLGGKEGRYFGELSWLSGFRQIDKIFPDSVLITTTLLVFENLKASATSFFF